MLRRCNILVLIYDYYPGEFQFCACLQVNGNEYKIIRSMIHKRSKSKQIASPKSFVKKCRLCQLPSKPKYTCLLQFLHLNKKYLLNDVKAGMSCKFDNFVTGKLKTYQGGILEFQKQYGNFRTLQKLYSWNEVLENITSVIQNRTNVDKYQPVHFSSNIYYLMKRFYQKKRDINKFKTKGKNSEDIGKSTQPGDIKMLKNSKSQKQLKCSRLKSVKKGIKKKNQSFLQMQKLTKSIKKMYCNISNKKKLNNYSKQLKQGQELGNQKNLNFIDKQIEQKLSFIRSTSAPKKKKRKGNNLLSNQDLYGLRRSNISQDKDKNNQQYNSKRVATETINDNIQPLTPIIKNFYTPGQYFCNEKYIYQGQSEKNKFTKRKSKMSQSRSKKCLSRSRSKKKQIQIYKVNKLSKGVPQTKKK